MLTSGYNEDFLNVLPDPTFIEFFFTMATLKFGYFVTT